MLTLTLPLPPSLNSYQPHANRGGRCVRYHSKQAKAFKNSVFKIVRDSQAVLGLNTSIGIEIEINPRDRRKIDLDNRLKACLDSLESAGVFLDDSQIDHLTVWRGEIVKGGRCVVNLWELS